jgi:hypothetical protein
MLLATDSTAQPLAVNLALNFRAETLELVLNVFGAKSEAGEMHEERSGFSPPLDEGRPDW